MPYKRVLVALDLGETSASVIGKGAELARSHNAELHIMHAVEPLSITYGGDIPMDFSSIQEEIYQQATLQLTKFCSNHHIAEAARHLVIGRPEVEIPATAKSLAADLIVIGSHAGFRLALLLGSTADGVLHSAECDVLAVRV